MSISLKDRIAGAERDAVTEESPIAALFHNAQAGEPVAATTPGTSSKFVELPVDLLDEIPQKFSLREEELPELRDSIIARGILHRMVIRPNPGHPGRYEIISGRRRRRAAMMAGYTTVPCEIIEADDVEARLKMLDGNLEQRTELLPSEKAWAYRERMELLKHQGKRSDLENVKNDPNPLGENELLTSSQIETKLRSDEEVAKGTKHSRATIQRYIRLSYLTPELLEEVDNKKLGLAAGESLSYLTPEKQMVVYEYFFLDHKKQITAALAESLRAVGEKEALTPGRIQDILSPQVKKPVKISKVSVPMKPLRKFFPAEMSAKEIEKQITEIVTEYFKAHSQGGD